MRTTIDKAGRLVIPKEMRERIGLHPGPVDVRVDGAGLRVDPIAGDHLVARGARLVVGSSGAAVTDEDVQRLRAADQR